MFCSRFLITQCISMTAFNLVVACLCILMFLLTIEGSGYSLFDHYGTATCQVVDVIKYPHLGEVAVNVQVTDQTTYRNETVDLRFHGNPEPKWLIEKNASHECYYIRYYHGEIDQNRLFFDQSEIQNRQKITLHSSIGCLLGVFLGSICYYLFLAYHQVREPVPTEDPIMSVNQTELNSPSSVGNSTESEESENECVVCLRRLFHPTKNRPLAPPTTCCHRVIHEKCYLEWLQNHNRCPGCNVEIT